MGTFIDLQGNFLAIAEGEHHFTGDPAFLLAASSEMPDSSEGEHLRTVFRGHHVSDFLSLTPNRSLLRADVAVGIDFHLDAAVAENPFGDHRDHIDSLVFTPDDERGRFVIRIGGSASDGRWENRILGHQRSVPPLRGFQKGHHLLFLFQSPLGDQHRVKALEFPVDVAVTVTGTCLTGADATEDWTGIAIDFLVLNRLGNRFAHACIPFCWIAWRTRSGVAGMR